MLDRFWLEFSAMSRRLGGARSDEGFEVFGGADGFHSRAALMGCRWQTFVARPDHPKGEPQLGRRGLYATMHFIVADLTDSGDVGRVAADISPGGRLDVLVLSSGTYERSDELARPSSVRSQLMS
jgi:hypothetical protein